MSKFSELMKEKRVKLGVTLREFCQKNGIDAGNYSRLERGLYPPPNRELLEKYALALQLKPGTDEWFELFDLAAACRGEFPADLMEEAELVEKLPVLFRTMRAKPISSEGLDDLIDRIRRS